MNFGEFNIDPIYSYNKDILIRIINNYINLSKNINTVPDNILEVLDKYNEYANIYVTNASLNEPTIKVYKEFTDGIKYILYLHKNNNKYSISYIQYYNICYSCLSNNCGCESSVIQYNYILDNQYLGNNYEFSVMVYNILVKDHYNIFHNNINIDYINNLLLNYYF